MTALRAVDVISPRVVRADAEQRIADVQADIARADATHVAVFDQGRFRGVVSLREAAQRSRERIFADLLPRAAAAPVAGDSPADDLCRPRLGDAVPVVGADGQFLGVVTPESLFEALLKEQEQSAGRIRGLQDDLRVASRWAVVGEMASGIAHEVHQPVAAIANFAQGAIRRMGSGSVDPEELAGVFHEILGLCDQAAATIRRIREYIHERSPEPVAVDIATVIRDAFELARPDLERHRFEYAAAVAGDVGPVWGHPAQLVQVVLNLVLNAVEAATGTDMPRRVDIAAVREAPGTVRVTVADSGPGIPPEIGERVFDQLFTTKADALGLGLPLCRSVVARHGGQLWLEPGEPTGSRVCFTLRAVRPQSSGG
jgi:C4-dicarboxylate-specific signal transduction histidine kinase